MWHYVEVTESYWLVLKCVDMLKARGGRSVCKLEAKDLREAEVLWIKDIQ